MIEYENQLKIYSFKESKKDTENYLQTYWLNQEEYEIFWKKILLNIFKEYRIKLPNLVFNDNYEIIPMKGGLLFSNEDFKLLQECMKNCGDDYFVIIQQYNELDPPYNINSEGKRIILPKLMFKYPVDISWDDFSINDGICYQLFQRPVGNYFIFGNNSNWGKYVANDEEYPLDILGFKNKLSHFFINKFKNSIDDYKDLRKWLPNSYVKYL